MKPAKIIFLSFILTAAFAFVVYKAYSSRDEQNEQISQLQNENNQLKEGLSRIEKNLTRLSDAARSKPKIDTGIALHEAENRIAESDVMNKKHQLLDVQLQAVLEKQAKLEQALLSIQASLDAPPAELASEEPVMVGSEPQIDATEEQINVTESLYNNFEQQQLDSDWAEATRQAIEQSVSTYPDKIQLNHSECRQTMCQMEIALHDAETQREDFEQLMQEIPGEGERFFETREDGTVIVYMARDGYELMN